MNKRIYLICIILDQLQLISQGPHIPEKTQIILGL